jgi:ribosomal protein S17
MLNKIIIGAVIMAAATATAQMPDEVKAKVDAIKASVKSEVKAKGKFQEVRAKTGDRVLIHDGKNIIAIRDLDPFEAMSVPNTRTVFVGNDGQINAEINKLGLAEKTKAKAVETR